MSRTVLRQLLTRQPDVRALVASVAEALGTPVTVEDTQGHVLQGNGVAAPASRYPVSHDGRPIGWVAGAQSVWAVAALLDHLVAAESERKTLGAEALHLYREINLIYRFSEKLAALLDLEAVAGLTLREARHLIVATDGAVMLLEEGGELTTLAGFGDALPHLMGFRLGEGVVGSITASGTAEVVNDVESDPRRVRDGTGLASLVCAPLKVGERVIGLLVLASSVKMDYTAAELKLLNTLALQAATAIENARLFERTVEAARERERLLALHQQTELARARLEHEFDLAARIQADLFPTVLTCPAGYEVAARSRPARRCGGDYYDALVLPAPHAEDHVLFCVADVSGKGLPAALLMSNMQATLRALVGQPRPLTTLAAQASELLFTSTAPEKYVTAALLDLAPGSGKGHFVGAGHVNNLIIDDAGRARMLTSTGTPLGLLPPGIPFETAAVDIAPGDTVVLFSDGATDAQNVDGEEFGEARLIDIARASAGQPAAAVVARIFDAIDRFATGAAQFDDITLLVVKRVVTAGS